MYTTTLASLARNRTMGWPVSLHSKHQGSVAQTRLRIFRIDGPLRPAETTEGRDEDHSMAKTGQDRQAWHSRCASAGAGADAGAGAEAGVAAGSNAGSSSRGWSRAGRSGHLAPISLPWLFSLSRMRSSVSAPPWTSIQYCSRRSRTTRPSEGKGRLAPAKRLSRPGAVLG